MVEDTVGHTLTRHFANQISSVYADILNFAFNNFNGISSGTIYSFLGDVRHTHGVWIKGPAHPRTETTTIPHIFMQLLTKRECISGKHVKYFETTIKGVYMGFTLTACNRLQATHWKGMNRHLVVAGQTAVSLIIKEAKINNLNVWENNQVPLSIKNAVRTMDAEQVIGGYLSDPELEGYMANIRRLIHMCLASSHDRAVHCYRGSKAENKVIEWITKNAFVLYHAYHYNKSLRYDASLKAKQLCIEFQLPKWSETI